MHNWPLYGVCYYIGIIVSHITIARYIARWRGKIISAPLQTYSVYMVLLVKGFLEGYHLRRKPKPRTLVNRVIMTLVLTFYESLIIISLDSDQSEATVTGKISDCCDCVCAMRGGSKLSGQCVYNVQWCR